MNDESLVDIPGGTVFHKIRNAYKICSLKCNDQFNLSDIYIYFVNEACFYFCLSRRKKLLLEKHENMYFIIFVFRYGGWLWGECRQIVKELSIPIMTSHFLSLQSLFTTWIYLFASITGKKPRMSKYSEPSAFISELFKLFSN